MINRGYNKHFFIIVLYILNATNSFALDNVNSNIKILDGLNAPDNIIFFNEREEQCSLDQFEGKTILLVFWATWSASCVKNILDLDMLQKDFQKLPFEIIPISQDYQGIEIIRKHFKNYNIRNLSIYYDYKNQLFKALEIIGIPTSILINPNGKMILSFIGNIDWYDDEIRNLILSNIPGKYPEPKNSRKTQFLNHSIGPLKSKQQKIDSKKDKKQSSGLPLNKKN